MNQLTPKQRLAQADADRAGRALVTMIDGRVAIILPPEVDPEKTAERIAWITNALKELPQ